jgi:diacylglycerol kinase (ATP)
MYNSGNSNNLSGKKLLFVINPTAGLKRQDYFSAVRDAADDYGFQYLIYKTTGKNDGREIRRHIEDFNPVTVVAVGGDGTINLVAKELLGSRINLGIIPAGSANGLAYNLGIPDDFSEAMKIISVSAPEPFDVISINDKYYCLHLSDIGINARIVKRFEKEGDKGLIGYGRQLFKELFEDKTYFTLKLEVPGKFIRKLKAEMLVIANAESFGTGMIINPGASYNDGQFEIIIIRPYPWWFVFKLLFASVTGRFNKMKYIKVFSLKKAKVILSEPEEFQVDGEIIPDVSSLKIKIIPGALQVLGA